MFRGHAGGQTRLAGNVYVPPVLAQRRAVRYLASYEPPGYGAEQRVIPRFPERGQGLFPPNVAYVRVDKIGTHCMYGTLNSITMLRTLK